MSLVMSSIGDVESLKRVLNYSAADDVKIHLFTNNHTPVAADTLSNYTESTATGYGAVTLTGTDWTISTIGGVTTATHATAVTFTYTAAENVYGYYITNNASTVLLWAELFSTYCPIPSGGGSVSVIPKITCA